MPSFSQTQPDVTNAHTLSISASLGYLSGESKEYVYDTPSGQKISELDWKISSAPILRGEVYFPLFHRLDVNAQGWITLDQGNAVMDDYDWLNPNQTFWTHWSHHDDTHLRHANQFDLNLRAWFIQKQSYELGGIAGYQRNLFSFRAQGGCYTYDNGKKTGCFTPGQSVLGYKQIFKSPYIGLAGTYRMRSIELNGLFRLSNWVKANDVDQHYLRNLTFYDQGNDFAYYNTVLNAGVFLKPHVKLFVEGSLSYFLKNYSDTEMIDNNTGSQEYSPQGSSGLGNRNYIIALGIQYHIDK